MKTSYDTKTQCADLGGCESMWGVYRYMYATLYFLMGGCCRLCPYNYKYLLAGYYMLCFAVGLLLNNYLQKVKLLFLLHKRAIGRILQIMLFFIYRLASRQWSCRFAL